MSTEKGEPTALVPAQSTALSRAEKNSLAARGHDLLKKKEEAAEWLRKGFEFQEAAPANPFCPTGPVDPYGFNPVIAAQYLRQVMAGTTPELAARNLQMTPEDQEDAHTVHFYIPSWVDWAPSVLEQLEKRITALREAFLCFEKGHEIDPLNAELLYWLANAYCCGEGVQQDEGRAIALYRKAADLGYAPAMEAIGDAYAQRGFTHLPKDEEQAAKWYRSAADRGWE